MIAIQADVISGVMKPLSMTRFGADCGFDAFMNMDFSVTRIILELRPQ